MRGQVSELAGEATVSDDRFYTMMDFVGAAEATWDLVRETPAGPLIEPTLPASTRPSMASNSPSSLSYWGTNLVSGPRSIRY